MDQTAVTWIEETIGRKHMNEFLKSVIDQAKEKEKEYLENLKDFDTWKEWKNRQQ
jgi:hypothetical protein